MPLLYRNRSYILSKDPYFAQALDDVMGYMERTMSAVNVAPNGEKDAPPPISALSVTANSGIFDISITDNSSQVSRGINYFVEYSTTAQFDAPTVVDLGASRNYRATWGNQTLYFRAYSGYPTSPRSTPVYFGSQTAPTAVVGGGANAGPAPQPSNGSGTSEGSSGGDGGFGEEPTRSPAARRGLELP